MRFIYLIIHKFLCNWNKFYKLWIIINKHNINTSEIIYRYNNYIGYDDWIIARKSESIYMYMGYNKINNKITSELEKLHNVKNYI